MCTGVWLKSSKYFLWGLKRQGFASRSVEKMFIQNNSISHSLAHQVVLFYKYSCVMGNHIPVSAFSSSQGRFLSI